MAKKRVPALSAALYAIAGMLILYTIWSASHSVSYISELVAMGQLAVDGNEYDIVSFYMSNSAQYALFAVILFALGRVLQKISAVSRAHPDKKDKTASSGEVSGNEDSEDDFEDWFQNNRS